MNIYKYIRPPAQDLSATKRSEKYIYRHTLFISLDLSRKILGRRPVDTSFMVHFPRPATETKSSLVQSICSEGACSSAHLCSRLCGVLVLQRALVCYVFLRGQLQLFDTSLQRGCIYSPGRLLRRPLVLELVEGPVSRGQASRLAECRANAFRSEIHSKSTSLASAYGALDKLEDKRAAQKAAWAVDADTWRNPSVLLSLAAAEMYEKGICRCSSE